MLKFGQILGVQCVEHAVEFKMNEDDVDHCKINARDFFISTQVFSLNKFYYPLL